MNFLLTAILAVQMLTALGMIGLILIQHGKGADMGAAFGSGSSGSLFGASGSANFLSRTTAVLAAVFFACTLLLAYFGNLRAGRVGQRARTRRRRPRRHPRRRLRARQPRSRPPRRRRPARAQPSCRPRPPHRAPRRFRRAEVNRPAAREPPARRCSRPFLPLCG